MIGGPLRIVLRVRDRASSAIRVVRQLARGVEVAHALIEALRNGPPVAMSLSCPGCNTQHVDRLDTATGIDWAKRPHAEHLCSGCGLLFTPYPFNTVGVATERVTQ